MTQAIETLETRVSSITQYCESLLQNVTETIDGRMSRLDSLLSHMAEQQSARMEAASSVPSHEAWPAPATESRVVDSEPTKIAVYDEPFNDSSPQMVFRSRSLRNKPGSCRCRHGGRHGSGTGRAPLLVHRVGSAGQPTVTCR